MSQTKAQLVAPIGIVTAPGMVVSGVVTASSLDGNLIGNAGGLSGSPDIHVGVVTATSFVGDVTGIVTGRATSLVNTGAGTSNLNLGTITATNFHGAGGSLSNVTVSAWTNQTVTADGASTTIDLSSGNVILFNQSASTTVSFANTSNGSVYLIREKDDTTTARTITWPANVYWNGGSAPTLIDDSIDGDAQIFNFITRDEGVTWFASEKYKKDTLAPYELWTWGYNLKGALGKNEIVQYSSPVQIPGTTWHMVAPISGSYAGASAIKSDGTLWSWGDGTYGLLGLGSQNDFSSPVQVGTDENWAALNAGGKIKIASKTDGTLWI